MLPLNPIELLLLMALINAGLYLVMGLWKIRSRVALVPFLGASLVLGAALYTALFVSAVQGTRWDLGWTETTIWVSASLIMLLGFLVVNAVFALAVYSLGQGGSWVLTRPVPVPVGGFSSRRSKSRSRKTRKKDSRKTSPGKVERAVEASGPSPATGTSPSAVETSHPEPEPAAPEMAPAEDPAEEASESLPRKAASPEGAKGSQAVPAPPEASNVDAEPALVVDRAESQSETMDSSPSGRESADADVEAPAPTAVVEEESPGASEERREPEPPAEPMTSEEPEDADSVVILEGESQEQEPVEDTILAALAAVSRDEPESGTEEEAGVTPGERAMAGEAELEAVSTPAPEPEPESEPEPEPEEDPEVVRLRQENERKRRLASAELNRKRKEWEQKQREQAEADAWGE